MRVEIQGLAENLIESVGRKGRETRDGLPEGDEWRRPICPVRVEKRADGSAAAGRRDIEMIPHRGGFHPWRDVDQLGLELVTRVHHAAEQRVGGARILTQRGVTREEPQERGR
jgi:hypothetical protein